MTFARRMGLWAMVLCAIVLARQLAFLNNSPTVVVGRPAKIGPAALACTTPIEWRSPRGPELRCGTEPRFAVLPPLFAGDAVLPGPPLVRLPAAMGDTMRLVLGLPLDVNQVSAHTLALLPGISPNVASRIVQHRTAYGPFATLDDLLRVKGVGKSTLRETSAHLTVRHVGLVTQPNSLVYPPG